uniref:E3 SUMO protein ligase SIZ1-like proteon n=1 Tax=Ettlia sp. YC001 TaxID=1191503 RepID=A0A411H971_9CHLO|nr:E3 SUMO protein ligase SIZ1-like proteon [Ettlia sp. YC001]
MGKLDLDIIKAKVNAFRIAEAKDVLQQLGMSRSGNKPDLIARIMSVFSDAATLTAHGYRPRDSNRQELAASVIERVHNVQASQGHVPWQARRHISDLEQKAAAKGSAKDDSGVQAEAGSVAGSASAAEGPNKRQKVVSGLQDGPAVDEVITAFLTGADALSNTKVRCICSEHVERGQMLQCEGAFCGVWQHAACVRQHMRNTQPPPGPPGTTSASRQQFYCERCRVARADPFWEIFDPTVMPPAVANKFVKHATVHNALNQPTQVAVHGTGLKSMVLQKSNVMLLRAKPQEYKLMALCLELDDTVPFRIHWPCMPTYHLRRPTGRWCQVRVMQRPVSHYLGTNQRDEGCDLRPLLPPTGGTNAAGMMRKSLQLELADPQHTYLLLVYMMRRRSREQVKALMKPPEQLAQAVQRVCRHMHGGHNPARQCTAGDAAAPAAAGQPAAAAANRTANGVQTIESDDDDDIIVGNIVVSLKDPMSGARMNVPVRFTDTAGTAPSAFDLDTFLEMAQRSKKWLDPHNQEPSTIQNLQVDSYLAHILACLADNPEVTEIEINPDGQWRPAGSSSDFMSVLDQQKDMAAAAAQAAAAAATVGQAVAAAAAAASDDSDDEDDAEELRRAMAEFAAANQKAQAERAAAAAAAARKAVDVIDLVSDDEDEQPSAAAAAGVGSIQAAAGSGAPPAAANPIQQGLRIRLPQRLPQQHQQQPLQHMQHQQQPGARLAAGTTAAAAVGPPAPHSLGLGALEQQQAGLSRTLSQGAVPGVSGVHHPQQQQQQVWQQPGYSSPYSSSSTCSSIWLIWGYRMVSMQLANNSSNSSSRYGRCRYLWGL